MRIVPLLGLACLLVGCFSSHGISDSRLRDGYIAKITKCVADNHTLDNREEVHEFLRGDGAAEVQVLRFVNNRHPLEEEWKIKIGPIEGGEWHKIEGKDVSTFELRRKRGPGGVFLFKLGEGRWYVPRWASDCEMLRGSWCEVREGLTYECYSEKI